MTLRMRRHYCIWCGEECPPNGPSRCRYAYGKRHLWKRANYHVTAYGTQAMGQLAGVALPEMGDTELQGRNAGRIMELLPQVWIDHAGELTRGDYD